jgi:hypothetical protein
MTANDEIQNNDATIREKAQFICAKFPGCWSQRTTGEEATENIRAANYEYLAAINHLFTEAEIHEMDVAVQNHGIIRGMNHS